MRIPRWAALVASGRGIHRAIRTAVAGMGPGLDRRWSIGVVPRRTVVLGGRSPRPEEEERQHEQRGKGMPGGHEGNLPPRLADNVKTS